MDNSKTSPKPSSMPLAFFGTADFSVPGLKSLIAAGYPISVVVTKPDTIKGRGRKLEPPQVKTVAQAHDLPVIQPESKDQLAPQLEKFDIKTGIVVSYGMILPVRVLEMFSLPLVNVHASLLPKWRGPSPIEAAILSGDKHTGVSIMQVSEAMDAGPVYGFSQIPLKPEVTQPDAYKTLSQLGADTLLSLLPGILTGAIDPIPQDDASATYCKLIKKSDGAIDWGVPATRIERQIRAFLTWPGSFTFINSTRVTIESAQVIDLSGPAGETDVVDGKLIIYARNQALKIDRLKPAGKKSISSSEFIRGYLKN